jgi:hypothetical protein
LTLIYCSSVAGATLDLTDFVALAHGGAGGNGDALAGAASRGQRLAAAAKAADADETLNARAALLQQIIVDESGMVNALSSRRLYRSLMIIPATLL